ncbi:SDR family oxidoreductase [Acuticoccus mangrovi]|uniref:SDR family oxidoreductase n=1 Tax=Acuticoccus mangrovi TaxID=2796142 RepID=A0A934IKT9_9HYPH|nr:SDR family oxidoreductase [Acuticoccus mangrovi]MBJ3775637.1 SDR family oxidoreductase [Acuticoccus mangrovi]
MDLGLAGRTAIVCGASKGLGRACAEALAREGVDVTLVARTPETLESAAEAIAAAAPSTTVTTLPADVGTLAGVETIIAGRPQADILVTNSGHSPKGEELEWDAAAWERATYHHMIAPIMLIRHYVAGMSERRFGRVVNITSRAIRAPMEYMTLGNAPRAGLTGFVATVSRKVAKDNVAINNLLPGPFATATQAKGLQRLAALADRDLAEFTEERTAQVPAHRFGDPSEVGALCAYLCSAQAGFIVGQNILIDGGAVNLV